MGTEHLACMQSFYVKARKKEGLVGRPRCRWEDDDKIRLGGNRMGWYGLD
jgi:hypothetical protein